MKYRLLVTFAFWLNTFCFAVVAQNITVSKIPFLDQLPVNAIHKIYQDSEGYMWYGTINGLCRYDGYNIRIFRSDLQHPGLMASSDITAIVEDRNSRIWFGTFRGAYILDKKDYSIRPLKDQRLQGKKISGMYTTSDGSIWVCISGVLLRYDSDEKLINEYSLFINNASGDIQHLAEDKVGNILLTLGGDIIYKINESTGTFQPFIQINGAGINYFLTDEKHACLWVGTWGNGIIRLDAPTSAQSEIIRQPLPVNSKRETDPHIIQLVQDDAYGHLWAVTYTDLLAFKITEEKMLRQIDTSEFLPQCNNMLSGIVKDKKGNLWVPAFNLESFIINYQNNTVKEYPVLPLKKYINGNPAITCICRDEDGVFWFSQDRTGLCIYAEERQEIKYYSDYPELRWLALENISQIQKSGKHGKVWVAPFGPEVYGLKRNGMELKLTEHIRLSRVNRNAGNVESLYEDTQGNLWIGTTTGLFIYDPEQDRLEQIKEINNIVSGMVETSDGILCKGVKTKSAINKNLKKPSTPY